MRAWLALEKQQKGKGCEETCATNALDDLKDLKLTTNYPGGAETSINKWDKIIQTLEELENSIQNYFKPLLSHCIKQHSMGG